VLQAQPASAIGVYDPFVWKLAPTISAGTSGDLDVDVLVTDAAGEPRPGAVVRLWLDVDDFTRVYRTQTTAAQNGRARISIPADALAQGAGDRWVHITAGETYPLVETIVPIEN
jgi:hypothetical protein